MKRNRLLWHADSCCSHFFEGKCFILYGHANTQSYIHDFWFCSELLQFLVDEAKFAIDIDSGILHPSLLILKYHSLSSNLSGASYKAWYCDHPKIGKFGWKWGLQTTLFHFKFVDLLSLSSVREGEEVKYMFELKYSFFIKAVLLRIADFFFSLK